MVLRSKQWNIEKHHCIVSAAASGIRSFERSVILIFMNSSHAHKFVMPASICPWQFAAWCCCVVAVYFCSTASTCFTMQAVPLIVVTQSCMQNLIFAVIQRNPILKLYGIILFNAKISYLVYLILCKLESSMRKWWICFIRYLFLLESMLNGQF